MDSHLLVEPLEETLKDYSANPDKRVVGIHKCVPKRQEEIRVLNQSLWLKSLTATQRCWAGNANVLPFLRDKSPHVPTPNLENQETVFVIPLTTEQPGVRDSSFSKSALLSFSCSTLSVPNCHATRRSTRAGILQCHRSCLLQVRFFLL
ncbi:hypothetical protein CSKR_100278 [Clonorchis sinensis]|uniref:Uncharacterized protein n=1 Tax=Clonorchis sinensis TaxID=79923 RepID=A0A419PE12_CLOSI|nr:hypothetical protein CSKR_100278 [Clonorchis sinensis]